MGTPAAGKPPEVTQLSPGDLLKYLDLLGKYGPLIEKLIATLLGLQDVKAGDKGDLPPVKSWLPGGHEAEFDIGYKILR